MAAVQKPSLLKVDPIHTLPAGIDLAAVLSSQNAGQPGTTSNDLLQLVTKEIASQPEQTALNQLALLWNTFITDTAFESTTCSTIIPATLPALSEATNSAATIRQPLTDLITASVGSGSSMLATPLTSPTLSLLYQVLTTAAGQTAPIPTVADILAFTLALPIQAIHDLLISPTDPDPADAVFQDIGISSLAGLYYGVTDIIPPAIQDNQSQYAHYPLLHSNPPSSNI
jgi:hypothetical protein